MKKFITIQIFKTHFRSKVFFFYIMIRKEIIEETIEWGDLPCNTQLEEFQRQEIPETSCTKEETPLSNTCPLETI